MQAMKRRRGSSQGRNQGAVDRGARPVRERKGRTMVDRSQQRACRDGNGGETRGTGSHAVGGRPRSVARWTRPPGSPPGLRARAPASSSQTGRRLQVGADEKNLGRATGFAASRVEPIETIGKPPGARETKRTK